MLATDVDAWGRRTRCVICGVKLKPHPRAGRPRMQCGSHACQQEIHNIRRRRLRAAARLGAA